MIMKTIKLWFFGVCLGLVKQIVFAVRPSQKKGERNLVSWRNCAYTEVTFGPFWFFRWAKDVRAVYGPETQMLCYCCTTSLHLRFLPPPSRSIVRRFPFALF